MIISNLVGALIRTLLTEDQLLQWGWRAAFVSGAAILPVAVFLRLYGKEHHPNEGEYDGSSSAAEESSHHGEGGISSSMSTASQQQKHPLREAVRRENWPALLSSILAPMLYGGGYYISVVW